MHERDADIANKRKRATDDADVYPHRNGRGEIVGYRGPYWVQTYRGPARRTVSGKTKTETRAKLTRAKAEAGGVAFDAGKQTLGDYLERWLSDSVKNTVKPTTFESYERQVRVHISPALGHLKLDRLSPANVQAVYGRKLDAGMSPSSVRRTHAVLHRALEQARRWLVSENVAAATVPPGPRKKKIGPQGNRQARALLEAARGEGLEAVFVPALTAGLRIGELLGLKWEDADSSAGPCASP